MNYYLLAALVVVGIWILLDERKNWVLVYETTGHAMQTAQAKFSFLKSQGIKCRMRTPAIRGMRFGGMTSPAAMACVKVEVHKKDLEKARSLLAEPGK